MNSLGVVFDAVQQGELPAVAAVKGEWGQCLCAGWTRPVTA